MTPKFHTGGIIEQEGSEPVLYHGLCGCPMPKGLVRREGEAVLTKQGVEKAGFINVVMKMNLGDQLTRVRSRSIILRKRGLDGNQG